MPEALLLLGVFAADLFGFALLALSQTKHWRQVTGAAAPARGRIRAMRALGAALLGLAYALALRRDGPSFGTLLWVTALSPTALAVACSLAWRPRALRPLTRPWRRRGADAAP